jgi:hypothetical protein
VAPYMQTIAVLPLRLQGLVQFGSVQKVSVLKTPYNLAASCQCSLYHLSTEELLNCLR